MLKISQKHTSKFPLAFIIKKGKDLFEEAGITFSLITYPLFNEFPYEKSE